MYIIIPIHVIVVVGAVCNRTDEGITFGLAQVQRISTMYFPIFKKNYMPLPKWRVVVVLSGFSWPAAYYTTNDLSRVYLETCLSPRPSSHGRRDLLKQIKGRLLFGARLTALDLRAPAFWIYIYYIDKVYNMYMCVYTTNAPGRRWRQFVSKTHTISLSPRIPAIAASMPPPKAATSSIGW